MSKPDLSYIEEDLRELAVPISELSFDPYQAKDHGRDSIDAIKASFRAHGQKKPVVVQKNGMVTKAGNGTLQAVQELASELGWTHIAVVRSGDSEDDLRAYALRDNRSAEHAKWKPAVVLAELKHLSEAGFEPKSLGWSTDDLAGLTRLAVGEERRRELQGGTAGADDEAKVDQAEELRKQWGVELGQLWQLGEHRLICGDSTDPKTVGRVLDGRKPLLMTTDPPYGVEYDAEWRNSAIREDGSVVAARAVGKVLNDDRADWSEAYHLFPGDVAYVWHPAGAKQGDFLSSLVASDFEVRMTIIWAKSQLVIGRGHYHIQHEPCFYGVRRGSTAHWRGDRKQTTLWEIQKNQKSETGHSTQKPIECMARPIRNHESEYVYEPFCGSGTTIMAAEQEGVKCLAIELNPPYVAISLQRFLDVTGKTPVRIA